MAIPYTVVRSDRRTLAIQITRDHQVVLRAPRRLAARDIEAFVNDNAAWIEKNLDKMRRLKASAPEPDADEIAILKARARAYIPERVEFFARRMGLTPTGIKITAARTRFGSCSARDGLCFSCLLMRYSPEAIDYVVVHELAHIAHKNHSKTFYKLIEYYLPDYKRRKALLRGDPS